MNYPYDPYGGYESDEGDETGFRDPFAGYEEKESVEPVFKESVHDWERTGVYSKVQDLISVVGEIDRKAMRQMSARDRFLIFTDGIAREMKMPNTDINTILEEASRIPNIKYRNPTAFILGFIVSKGGRKLDKQKLNEIMTKYEDKMNENNITPPDIIRYGRYWTSLK